jgi:hypothetical protein
MFSDTGSRGPEVSFPYIHHVGSWAVVDLSGKTPRSQIIHHPKSCSFELKVHL